MDKSAALFRASNLLIMDYPFDAALESALNICDEAVVVVGQSEDDTMDWVHSEASKYPGRVIIDQTVFTFDLMWQEKWWTLAQSLTDAEWLFYYDADEIIHENDVLDIKDAMADPNTHFLSFPFIHFYMTPLWQHKFWARSTKLGRRSAGYRMRNWRSEKMPKAPACQVVHGPNEVDANNPNQPHMAVMETPIYHYSWCRDATAINISHLKHNDWYADGKRDGLLDGRVPDVRPFPYAKAIQPLIVEGTVWPSDVYSHPAAIQGWMEDHVERWQKLEQQFSDLRRT